LLVTDKSLITILFINTCNNISYPFVGVEKDDYDNWLKYASKFESASFVKSLGLSKWCHW